MRRGHNAHARKSRGRVGTGCHTDTVPGISGTCVYRDVCCRLPCRGGQHNETHVGGVNDDRAPEQGGWERGGTPEQQPLSLGAITNLHTAVRGQ